MSHIFDALQRSEGEHSGAKSTVTELLERAERQALSQREAEADAIGILERELTIAETATLPRLAPAESLRRGAIALGDEADGPGRANIFESFETVRFSPSEEKRLVCLTDKESLAAEAFRLLRVRLRHLRKDKAMKRVLITSTVPQEGKSFAAANLACALASGSQEKILLLDGDLRRYTQSQLFGVKGKSGLCEYLQGKRSLASTIYRLDGAGFWLFPAGSAEGDPLGIIQSAKLPSMMTQLTEWFDWIIIDSPPMLPLADTTALARLADGILLVARRDVTEKRKLKKGLEALESGKLIGALLNSSHSAADREYYYYRSEHSADELSKVTH